MKNLNELGVQELDTMEMQKTDGGIIPLLIAGAIGWGSFALRTAVIGAAAYLIGNDILDSYEEGYEAGNN
ncbi:class IIb bacteriocin, lactobin A/cerein 7B family [Carboxylicivirga caseinilyticus]|uniref:class IIb bacteriocin, lactobin A/cerein 7B family n=1 Tax=Carboxylicivirga caseinilyticus TaxID=3417572 RepID=UPI003D3577E7|nr:class IIb bacteriocin, lactobin A/cerein 7B family [Marinilabiliaceae bacterium A049]